MHPKPRLPQASREQLGILRHLNKADVRYIAFGDFALNALDPARTIGNVQLWIEPTVENLQRLNTGIKTMFGPRSTTHIPLTTAEDPQPRRLLTLGDGAVRVGLYPAISGFAPIDFNDVFQRSNKQQVALLGSGGKLDGSVIIRQLDLNDLYRNVSESKAVHKVWNLETIERYAVGRNITLQLPAANNAAIYQSEQTTAGTALKRQNGRMVRDFDQIKRDLDLELVIQHYGYQLDTKKSRPGDAWRIYETGIKGDKQRIGVAAIDGYSAKHFVDLNDTQGFRGDVFRFMERMEHGNYRNIFQVVDQIMQNPGFEQQVRQIQPLRAVSESYFLKDTALRERELNDRYTIKPLTDSRYLEGRSVSKETLYAPEFDGRIKNVSYTNPKTGHVLTNTAFPMYSQDGYIVSMDIRNVGFKSYPEGERGEALWHSNRFYEIRQDVAVAGGNVITAGTTGNVFRPDGQTVAFLYRRDGQDQRVNLPVDDARGLFREVPVHRIVISESAVDALSFRQLNPEEPGERRLYVATGGQPGGKQTEFLQALLNKNPQAQLVLAQDGDNAGIRFAINYLGLDHPATNPDWQIKPYITYSAPARSALNNSPQNSTEANVSRLVQTEDDSSDVTQPSTDTAERTGVATPGSNKLHLEISHPMSGESGAGQRANEQVIQKLIDDIHRFVKKHSFNDDPADTERKVQEFQRETLLDVQKGLFVTKTTILFPNESNLLVKTLNALTDEIERRQGQKLFDVVRPTKLQKDFNEVLKERNGDPLPVSHNLRITEVPAIKPFERQKQGTFMAPLQSVETGTASDISSKISSPRSGIKPTAS